MGKKNQDSFRDSALSSGSSRLGKDLSNSVSDSLGATARGRFGAGFDNSDFAPADSRATAVQPGAAAAAAGNSRPPSNAAKVLRAVFGVIIAMVVVFLYVGTVVLLSRTLMPSWLPWTLAAAVALATGLPCGQWWRVLTGVRTRWVNYAAHAVALTGILAFAFVAANDSCASDEATKTPVTVERLYTETRHKTRRVSRRHYVQGPAYKVYCAEIRFDGGETRSFEIKKSLWDGLSTGNPATVETREGLFGFTVFTPSTLDQPGMHKKKKPRRTRHVGPRPRGAKIPTID